MIETQCPGTWPKHSSAPLLFISRERGQLLPIDTRSRGKPEAIRSSVGLVSINACPIVSRFLAPTEGSDKCNGKHCRWSRAPSF